MAARAEDLLPVEYFHVVFTLPAEIAQIAYWNKKAVYGLLFKASAETVMTIAADPKRMGAKVGLTSCRVALKSETRRFRHRVLPLVARFGCHGDFASRAPFRDVIDRG
jgi:hypothetical protein